jgi:hypothetical protein
MPDILPLEGFPGIPTSSFESDYAASGDGFTSGKTFTAGGSVNTKGSWTELIASTTKKIVALLISFGNIGTGAYDDMFLVDIGTGAAASEVVLIPNLYFHRERIYRQPNPSPVLFFVSIPAGTRIAGRCQAAGVVSNAIQVIINVYESDQ